MLKLTRAELDHVTGKYDKEPPPDKIAGLQTQIAQIAAAVENIGSLITAPAPTPTPAPPQGDLVATIVRNAAGKMTQIVISRSQS